MKYPAVSNYLNGSFVVDDLPALDVYNPSEGNVISRVPLSSHREVDRAVESAKAAFPAWSATPIKERVQVFYRYKALLEQQHRRAGGARHRGERQDRQRGARRGAQVGGAVASSRARCRRSSPGEVLEVSRGVECRIERYPLGVVASITPFNFPNMVPNWTIPNAIALGNCMILKPSRAGAAERRPHRRAAARGRASRRRVSRSCTADRKRSRRSAIIPASRRSASSARRKVAKIVYRRGTVEPQARASRSAARRTTSSSCPTPTAR